MKTKTQQLADRIRIIESYIAYVAHDSGLMPAPLWSHIKAHYSLWQRGHGRIPMKHIIKQWWRSL